MDNRLKEDLFDAMLKSALRDYSRDLSAQLPTESELGEPHVFSPEFAQDLRRAAKQKPPRRALRPATAVLVAIISVLLLAISVTAFRKPILNFILQRTEKSTSITVQSGEAARALASVSDENKKRLPAYIPAGFTLISVQDDELGVDLRYEDARGRVLLYGFYSFPGEISIDTEDAQFSQLKIKGRTAFLAAEDGSVILEVPTESFSFGISGDISQEEAVKIMESVNLY